MPTKSIDFKTPQSVPIEYAGKWIAWNSDHSRIVAHSETMEQLWLLVKELNIPNPVFEKVPRADVRFVGMR